PHRLKEHFFGILVQAETARDVELTRNELFQLKPIQLKQKLELSGVLLEIEATCLCYHIALKRNMKRQVIWLPHKGIKAQCCQVSAESLLTLQGKAGIILTCGRNM